jgi:polar amino acid transport system substrate-binding protein
MKFVAIKLLLGVLLSGITSMGVASDEIGVTIHVDDQYRPFSFVEKGVAKGIYINVLKRAFSKMPAFKVTLLPVPWRRGKRLMEMGQGYGLFPAFYHGHDWPYLYPYSLSFYSEKVIVVCTDKVLAQPRKHWPSDYKALIIGNQAGFDGFGGDRFRGLVEQGQIQYKEVNSPLVLIGMLSMKRFDCIMIEERSFDYEFDRFKRSADYDQKRHSQLKKGAVIGIDPVYIGYSQPAVKSGKHPYDLQFRRTFDSVIYQMQRSGEISRIMDAYR